MTSILPAPTTLIISPGHILDGGEGDALAGDGNFDDIPRLPGRASAQFLHAENHLGAGLAAHLLGAFLAGEAVGGLAVDGFYLVTAAEAGFRRRGVRVGLVDLDVSVLFGLVDDCALRG